MSLRGVIRLPCGTVTLSRHQMVALQQELQANLDAFGTSLPAICGATCDCDAPPDQRQLPYHICELDPGHPGMHEAASLGYFKTKDQRGRIPTCDK